MGQILGLGITHYPNLAAKLNMSRRMQQCLEDPTLPALMFPDVEADKRYYEALKNGDWELWRNTTLEAVEDRGHHELLNWFCLVGAMHEMGRTKPDESVFLESWITNSDKVFAVYRP